LVKVSKKNIAIILLITVIALNSIPSKTSALKSMNVGVDIWSGTSTTTFNNRHRQLLLESGLQIVRLEFSKNSVPNLRKLVPTIAEDDIKIVGLLIRPDFAPNNVEEWGKWVYDVVSEFKQFISIWEIWNEPNLDKFFTGTNPAKYTAFLKEGYTQAKNADPSCFVLGGSLVFTHGDTQRFLKEMYNNGAENYMDALAFHPYCSPLAPADKNSPNPFVKLKEIKEIMEDYGDTNNIWITEIGWSTSAVGESLQAEYLIKALEIAQNWGWVDAFIIYNWHGDKGLTNDEYKPRSSFYEVKKFIDGQTEENNLTNTQMPSPEVTNETEYSSNTSFISGDLNGDSIVDSIDLFIFARAYVDYSNSGVVNSSCDLDQDGDVDSEDFLAFLKDYNNN
jgi:hypothetical protein